MKTLETIQVLQDHGFKLIKGGDNVDQEKLLKVAKWAKENDFELGSLYTRFKEDTGDNKTSFVEFCAFMYDECKH